MDLDKYKLLKNKNIAEILDGDKTFGDFESPNIQSNFGLSNLQIGLPRLSGPDICDIAKIIDGKRVLIVPINATTPNISIKNLKTIDRDYIKSLSDRAIDNIENGHYDSALTQARTILEETFDYVLEKQNIEPSSKGDINKLYKQVKDEYKMHENKNADKRINRLLSGLENIVSAVSEMRNKNSDSHGVGERRLTIVSRAV